MLSEAIAPSEARKYQRNPRCLSDSKVRIEKPRERGGPPAGVPPRAGPARRRSPRAAAPRGLAAGRRARVGSWALPVGAAGGYLRTSLCTPHAGQRNTTFRTSHRHTCSASTASHAPQP